MMLAFLQFLASLWLFLYLMSALFFNVLRYENRTVLKDFCLKLIFSARPVEACSPINDPRKPDFANIQ
ncbi:hypothetical protein L596_001482 [Steinernema carpocapsae]|uniref:Uncharacterized protein n=1 Tax=Steinernema carpocapsae TaxID=34508 RepID=A0A4U8UNE4_STECR|nr:hypothetical protein L596_001482 [Steinernema carpocapsae]